MRSSFIREKLSCWFDSNGWRHSDTSFSSSERILEVHGPEYVSIICPMGNNVSEIKVYALGPSRGFVINLETGNIKVLKGMETDELAVSVRDLLLLPQSVLFIRGVFGES
jgi:hypothetical protein